MIDRSCVRCGLDCPHVEAGGMHYCPNCGPPIEAETPGMVRFAFGLGCETCGLAGRGPMLRDAREATTPDPPDPRDARVRDLEAALAQQRAVVAAARAYVEAEEREREIIGACDRRHGDAIGETDPSEHEACGNAMLAALCARSELTAAIHALVALPGGAT